ncbi:hypothetical protein [Sporosarcina sp. OR05]|uniref:hypothetical protein n=1 Tax=Sporosarcina sp. OR05 TaxID=2969819 RepID=UPI00352A5240
MGAEQEQLTEVTDERTYIETPIKTIFTKFARNRDVSLAYGEPIEMGLKKVLPVAKVKYAVGGGGDGSGGEGGGGAISIDPIGVFEITPDDVRYKSTKRPTIILLSTIVAMGFFYLVKRNNS